jgi:hypothetical protein
MILDKDMGATLQKATNKREVNGRRRPYGLQEEALSCSDQLDLAFCSICERASANRG